RPSAHLLPCTTVSGSWSIILIALDGGLHVVHTVHHVGLHFLRKYSCIREFSPGAGAKSGLRDVHPADLGVGHISGDICDPDYHQHHPDQARKTTGCSRGQTRHEPRSCRS
ncbi:hypothetical protein BO86DRAFT_444927, partial [Aspergillus japonicus CBS 114.51]